MNEQCNRPPKLRFQPLHFMLQRLTRPDVLAYVSFDLSTWFVQLRVHPTVQLAFLVQTQAGHMYRITGLPMGWSWAPVVAQVAAEAIVAETLRLAGSPTWVVVFVYIDNIIFAILRLEQDGGAGPAAGEVDRRVGIVEDAFRRACAAAGAAIKESATVRGRQADWLGTIVTVGTRQCVFRPRFVAKVRDVWPVLERAAERVTLREAWKLVALAVRALWVARRPLAEIVDALRWLVRAARELDGPSECAVANPATGGARRPGRRPLTWSSQVRLWAAAVEQLREVYRWLVDHDGRFEVWEAADEVAAWGVSDAAGGPEGMGGYAFRLRGGPLVVARIAVRATDHINFREADSAETGIAAVLLRRPPSGRLHWSLDSTVASGWIRRSWNPRVRLNRRALVRAAALRRAAVDLRLERVAGGDANPIDIVTRVDDACPRLRRRVTWLDSTDLACQCAQLCEHAVEAIRELVARPLASEPAGRGAA